jgi:hypothetical protein
MVHIVYSFELLISHLLKCIWCNLWLVISFSLHWMKFSWENERMSLVSIYWNFKNIYFSIHFTRIIYFINFYKHIISYPIYTFRINIEWYSNQYIKVLGSSELKYKKSRIHFLTSFEVKMVIVSKISSFLKIYHKQIIF